MKGKIIFKQLMTIGIFVMPIAFVASCATPSKSVLPTSEMNNVSDQSADLKINNLNSFVGKQLIVIYKEDFQLLNDQNSKSSWKQLENSSFVVNESNKQTHSITLSQNTFSKNKKWLVKVVEKNNLESEVLTLQKPFELPTFEISAKTVEREIASFPNSKNFNLNLKFKNIGLLAGKEINITYYAKGFEEIKTTLIHTMSQNEDSYEQNMPIWFFKDKIEGNNFFIEITTKNLDGKFYNLYSGPNQIESQESK